MKLKRIDHVGVIVANLMEAKHLMVQGFGLTPDRELQMPDLIAAFLKCGNASVELIEVTNPEMRRKRLGDSIARVEHIAFEVESLTETLTALEAMGIKTTGPPSIGGPFTSVWTVADTSGGVMYQFMQRTSPAEQSA
jgi:catechol 2,3-dioxygenase-like lactoylglutathione lyase family enzyme